MNNTSIFTSGDESVPHAQVIWMSGFNFVFVWGFDVKSARNLKKWPTTLKSSEKVFLTLLARKLVEWDHCRFSRLLGSSEDKWLVYCVKMLVCHYSAQHFTVFVKHLWWNKVLNWACGCCGKQEMCLLCQWLVWLPLTVKRASALFAGSYVYVWLICPNNICQNDVLAAWLGNAFNGRNFKLPH